MHKLWIKILFVIGGVLLLFSSIVGYLLVSPPSQYKIDTSPKKELVVLQNGASGICASPGCAPNPSVAREDINLTLTDEQLTVLVNNIASALKEAPVSDIRIKFSSGKIIAAAASSFMLFPGIITAVSHLDFNHFYVEKAYIGTIQAPDSVANFIEANAAGLIDKVFQYNDIFVKSMRFEGDKFIFEASVPKGMIEVNNGVITITKQVIIPH